MKFLKLLSFVLTILVNTIASSTAQTISQQASILLNDSALRQANVGISIYDAATNQYLYNHNATKYFVPASNTKIFSLYAGMAYLGDSLQGLKYYVDDNGEYILIPTGDPTFLHPDFNHQPVYNFLKKINSKCSIVDGVWKTTNYGRGWAWDDYNDDYMAERSMMPIYANAVIFSLLNNDLTVNPYKKFEIKSSNKKSNNFSVRRVVNKNIFETYAAEKPFESISIPFQTDTNLLRDMLLDTLHNISEIKFIQDVPTASYKKIKNINSQQVDSLFKPMMHRSDNFFAEQTLLMVSNSNLGYMNEEKMIAELLEKDLKDIPQKPQWVDGSGLSRYNLFTPQDFIYILNKLKNKFGFERVKNIFPTGGEGTLKNYYKSITGNIFAKTGTLTNHVALSGYLITKKNKLLLFSILVGNYTSPATPIRKAVEKFLVQVREKN